MNRMTIFAVTLAVALGGPGLAAAADEEPTFRQLLDECLPGMAAEKIPDRQQSQQKFQEACFKLGGPGKEAQREAAFKLIAAKLGPRTAKPARAWLLKQIEFNGRGECVDAVAALLDDKDPEIRDRARRALQNIPDPAANARLLEKLAGGGDAPWKIALANSLGYRGDRASVPALARLLGDKETALAAAAAGALGKIGGAEADAALAAAETSATQAMREPLGQARLNGAAGLLRAGKRAEAAQIYQTLAAPDQPRAVRLGAMQGTLDTAGARLPEVLAAMLAGKESDARAVAAGSLAGLSAEQVGAVVARVDGKLSDAAQGMLLGALVARRDKTGKPAALAAARSDKPEIKLAGVRALAVLGDASTVAFLIETMTAGGETAGPARDALRDSLGPGVDEAIINIMKKADVPLKGTLIDLLKDRGCVAATPALLAEARSADAGIGERAVRALGELAGPEDAPAMIKILLATGKGRRRDDAEKAVMFVCSRIEDEAKQADPVLKAMADASEADRCTLLPVAGRIGGLKALEAVRAAIQSDKPELRDAGVRALCNWPGADVADQLLAIAEIADDKGHRTWALRAYVRVVTLPGNRPAKQTLALLKKAMEMAERDDERRLVLSRAREIRDVQTLRWVVPYLDNEALSGEASRAVVELAHRRELMGPNFEEFVKALKKVTEVCKDQRLRDQAKRYMEGL